ncbi:MAG: hypothetical protein ACSLEY_01255 [Candidatus Saccharimonadales bacterium]
MEFLKHSRRRTMLSEAAYITLNVALAVAVFLVMLTTSSVGAALVIVLLGKWRIFAVRPHFWATNLVANMVDIIVSVSFVALLYSANGVVSAQIGLTLFFIGWLVLLKPRSEPVLVELQAGIGILLGVTALMQISYSWYASVVAAIMWIIGYSAARHVLSVYKEAHTTLLSLIWGLVMAELGWLVYHWTFAYDLVITGGIKLPQVAVFAGLLSFLAERTYASYHKNAGMVRFDEILLPFILTLSIILLSAIDGIIRGVS